MIYPLFRDLHLITIYWRLYFSLLCLTKAKWLINTPSSREVLSGSEEKGGNPNLKEKRMEGWCHITTGTRGEAFFHHRGWIMTSAGSFHHLITTINFRLIIIILFTERETILDENEQNVLLRLMKSFVAMVVVHNVVLCFDNPKFFHSSWCLWYHFKSGLSLYTWPVNGDKITPVARVM